MSLTDRINEDIKTAMKARDEVSLRALRSIKSALLLAGTEKGAADTLSEDSEMKILQKLAKQRKDSIEIFSAQKRDDLTAKEAEELKVIEKYLPAQMSEDEIRNILKNIISETGATGPQDTGKVMPAAMKQLSGKADGKTISTLLKELLQ